MADVELVIKISEDEYNRAIKRKEKFERDLTRYERLLVDGTRLEDYCESCIYKPTESEDD